MRKIQLKLFDRRRNQNFWCHFCYVPMDLWKRYTEKFKVTNLDTQVKTWLKEDFDLEVKYMEDISKAKTAIHDRYSKLLPGVFIPSNSDRQGWARVWLAEKLNKALEERQ